MMQLIGKGRTADVFTWDDGRVIKLFHDWFSTQSIERELNTARAVQDVVEAAPRPITFISTQR